MKNLWNKCPKWLKWFLILGIIGLLIYFIVKKMKQPKNNKYDVPTDLTITNPNTQSSTPNIGTAVPNNSYDQNNPFGLIRTGITWQGQNDLGNPKWESFTKISDGIRAGLINLKNGYFNNGLDTISKIIPVYSPAANQGNYQRFVKDLSGLDYQDKIDSINEKMAVAYAIACFESPRFKNFITITDFANEYKEYVQ